MNAPNLSHIAAPAQRPAQRADLSRLAGRTVVIKYGGAALAGTAPADAARDRILAGVAALQEAGAYPVLVHGGGPEINLWMQRLGKQPEWVDGLRVTDRETMEIVEMVLSGKINKELVGRLQNLAARAVGISGKDGGLLLAEKRLHRRPSGETLDLGFVGDVVNVNPAVLQAMTDYGQLIPVVAPVALGRDGETYNVNADAAAAAIAAGLGADIFVLLTDVPGIMADPADPATLCRRLTAEEVRRLVENGVIGGGMLPKVEACLAALAGGVHEAVILDGRDPDRLPAFLSGRDVPSTVLTGGARPERTGPAIQKVLADSACLMPTYARPPFVVVRARGTVVWDAEGKEYLDFLSGISVNNIGHCHPRVVAAVRDQAGRLMHCSNLYHNVPQSRLAARLAAMAGGGRVFFSNSGAEAVEAAIKLARKAYWQSRGADAPPPRIMTFRGAFHGRTLAALTATGKYTAGFAPLPAGFVQVPFNDLAAASAAFAPDICAVLVEPVQGEGGVVPAEQGFLAGLRRLCDEHGAMLIFDEIQTAFGRTGHMFAFEHYGVAPDVLTLAKALAGGMPLGATLARGRWADTFQPGDHGSTFGGNPVACAAALAAIDVLVEEDLIGRAQRVGAVFGERLRELAARHPVVTEVRGLGLMWGLELDRPAREFVESCRHRGLLVNGTAERVMRFLPPLVIDEGDVDRAVAVLDAVLAEARGVVGK